MSYPESTMKVNARIYKFPRELLHYTVHLSEHSEKLETKTFISVLEVRNSVEVRPRTRLFC